MECIFGKFVVNTKLGRVVDMLKGKAAIQGKLSEWENG